MHSWAGMGSPRCNRVAHGGEIRFCSQGRGASGYRAAALWPAACCRSCPPVPASRDLPLYFPAAGRGPKRSSLAGGPGKAGTRRPFVWRPMTVKRCGAMPADGKQRRRLRPQAAAGGHERLQASCRIAAPPPSVFLLSACTPVGRSAKHPARPVPGNLCGHTSACFYVECGASGCWVVLQSCGSANACRRSMARAPIRPNEAS